MSEFCPYLGVDVEGEMSDEHIIPEAIGGTLSYKLRVSKQANNSLGSSIDGPFINTSLLSLVRYQYGLGPNRVSLNGILAEELQVRLTWQDGNTPSITIKNFMQKEGDGSTGTIIAPIEQMAKVLPEIQKNYERKNKDVILGEEKSFSSNTVTLKINNDPIAINRGLAKIAFGAVLYQLPDYARQPEAQQWRNLLFAPTVEDMKTAAVRGGIITDEVLVKNIFGALPEHFHATTVFSLDGEHVEVAVTLFGTALFTMLAHVGKNMYDLQPGEFRSVGIDVRDRSVSMLTTVRQIE